MKTLIAVIALVLMCGCEDLPQSAIRGYHFAFSDNLAADKLQGSWSYFDCAGATRTILLFLNRQMSQVTIQFSSCTMVNSIPVYGPQEFEVTIGKDLDLKDDQNAAIQHLNSTDQVNVATVSQGYAATANSSTLCTLTNWTDTTAVDVSGMTCFGLASPHVGDIDYNETITFTGADTLTYSGKTFKKDL